MKETLQINLKSILGNTTLVLVLVAIVVAGLWSNAPKIFQFLLEMCVFAVQGLIVSLVALLILFVIQRIRSLSWYDREGAAVEMAAVRKRVGTERELPSDGISTSIQYASSTVLIAILLLASYLVHSP